MSGAAAVWFLLKSDAPIGGIPEARIKSGELPIKTELPAIAVTHVSSVPRLTVPANETVLHTDRVQVSWLFKSFETGGAGYPGVRAMDALIRAALPNTKGSVNGVNVDSILPDQAGPDLSEGDILQGSRDFIVKWTG